MSLTQRGSYKLIKIYSCQVQCRIRRFCDFPVYTWDIILYIINFALGIFLYVIISSLYTVDYLEVASATDESYLFVFCFFRGGVEKCFRHRVGVCRKKIFRFLGDGPWWYFHSMYIKNYVFASLKSVSLSLILVCWSL